MAEVGALKHAIHDRRRPPDKAVADLADRQHGVVAHRQLVRLGIGRGGIEHRVANGRLHRLHLGVYAVGRRRVSQHGRWMAAVLACGPRALLSHRSAAVLWGLRPTAPFRVDVATDRAKHGQNGIALHRPRHLPDGDRAVASGIPVTSVARTLADLAGVASRRELRRAIDEAERLRLLDPAAVEEIIGRSRGKRGVAALAALLRHHSGPPPITRSELERRFLDLCRDAGLPCPEANVVIDGVEVDVVWPHRRLVAELDGYAYHRTRMAFEDDRKRDAMLQLSGYRVVRITYQRLHDEPGEVADLVRALLSPSPERRDRAPVAGARARRGDPAW
jgi:hypothetical protein